MAKKKVRVRCPLCGMLVWQSRLNKDFDLEFVLQESSGRGYQKIEHKYQKMRIPDSEGGRAFCGVLALKMAEKAKEIIRMAGLNELIEINLEYHGTEAEEGFDEDEYDEEEEVGGEVEGEWEPETITYEVEFGEGVAEIEVPMVVEGDLKRRSVLGRLFSRSGGKPIKEMEEAAPDLEVVFDDYDYEVELEGGRIDG